MSFFKKLGKVATMGTGFGAAGLPGAVAAGGAYDAVTQKPQDDPRKAAMDAARQKQIQQQEALQKRLSSQAGRVRGEAEQYRQNLGDTQSKLFNAEQEGLRRQLAETMTGVNRGANRRGLLYSGLRQGDQAQAQGQYASGLQQARSQINQQTEAKARGLEDTADQAENMAMQAGIKRLGVEAGEAETNFAQALADQKQRQNDTNSLLGLGGSLFGTIARGKRG